jgi:tRNA pseudouridine65 synthase
MVLAFSPDTARELTLQFERKEVMKSYLAVVQGNPGAGTFRDKVLVKKKSKFRKDAVTHFKTLKSVETSIDCKEKANIILSLVEIKPETGRWHQIRQHFAKNRFDIVGDTHHGDFLLNKIVAEKTGIKRLLLHASSLAFVLPGTDTQKTFFSSVPEQFNQVLNAGL